MVLTSPDDRTLFIYSRKDSSLIDLVVSKNEADAFAVLTSCPVQTLQVVHQVGCVV